MLRCRGWLTFIKNEKIILIYTFIKKTIIYLKKKYEKKLMGHKK